MTEVSAGSDDEPTDLGVDLYRLIMAHPTAPAAWLGAVLGATRARVATEMRPLLERGWVRPDPSAPSRFVALDPDRIAEATSRRRAAAAARDAGLRSAGRSAVRSVVGDYADGRRRPTTTSGVEILLDPAAARARMYEVLLDATSNASLDTGGTEISAVRALPYDLAALASGLRDENVVQADSLEHGWQRQYLTATAEAGSDVRVADVVPLMMKVVVTAGRPVAVVPLDPEDVMVGTVIVQDPRLVAPLRAVVDDCVASSRPYLTPPAPSFTARQQSILRLMSAGHTDDAIAARLGVSLRTVVREVTAMMRETGAASRFQLGVLLGDGRGMVRRPPAGPPGGGPAGSRPPAPPP